MADQLAYIEVTDEGLRASGTISADHVDNLVRVKDAIRMYTLDHARPGAAVSFASLWEMLQATDLVVSSISSAYRARWPNWSAPLRGSHWLSLKGGLLEPLNTGAAGSLDHVIDVWARNLGHDSVLVEITSLEDQVKALVNSMEVSRATRLKHSPVIVIDAIEAAGAEHADPAAAELPAETAAAASKRHSMAQGWLQSRDVSARLGSTSETNPSQYATRMRKAGAVLGVWIPGERGYRYPPWQFGPDGTLPVIAELLKVLPPGNGSGWSQVEWFNAPHPRLGGKRPRELLAEAPNRVLNAATSQFKGHVDASW